MTTVKESADYDNFMQTEKKVKNEYASVLDSFFDEPIDSAIKKVKKTTLTSDPSIYRSVYVNFYSVQDVYDFCVLINQFIPGDTKEVYFPQYDRVLFEEDSEKKVNVVKELLAPKYGRDRKQKNKSSANLTDFVDVSTSSIDPAKKHGLNSAQAHWKYMPKFNQDSKYPYRQITMKFRKKEDYEAFEKLIDQTIVKREEIAWVPFISFPKREKKQLIKNRWLAEPKCDPKYPMYIISKNRQDSMYTSRALSRMKLHHYIIVEPQNMADYDAALDRFNIRKYVTLVEAPFSNHGDGPGRARNYAWDHSISLGATSHWVMDDNIFDFYRLDENLKCRMSTGAGFRAMEDFVDRYENVYISGPNYVFFCAETQKYEPFVPNTRIYSTLLIRNDCPHRWRGRYNEDTDICLRVLKDGNCTVQFNVFLQGKAATQTVKGGNTAEFYHAENVGNKDSWRNSYLNADGTINKSKMLVDMHPDVTTLEFKYGRWHHYVDYTPFVKNLLKFKPGIEVPEGINEYGMYMIHDYNKDEVQIGRDSKKSKVIITSEDTDDDDGE